MELFDQLVMEIKNTYKKTDNNLGWRFLATSKDTIENNSGIYLITQNPGGNTIIETHGVASCENGPAYIIEKWKSSKLPGESKLQIQFKLLFKNLARKYNYDNYKELLTQSLCGYFIPFRSPNYDSLLDKNKSIKLGKSLWRRIIENNNPYIIITIDKITNKYLKEIILDLKYNFVKEVRYPIGWGNYKATVLIYKDKKEYLKLLHFPHLSRFSIFGRSNSERYIKYIFEDF